MKPDAILAFSFGKNDKIDVVNWRIGVRAKRLAQKHNASLVIQYEIFNKAAQVTPLEDGDYKFNPVIIGANTIFEFVLEFKKFAEKEGWKKVLVVTAPSQYKRCVRDLKKMDFQIIEDIFAFKDYPVYVWYNVDSYQWRTRSPLLWWFIEIPLRLLPWWIYKKIAQRR